MGDQGTLALPADHHLTDKIHAQEHAIATRKGRNTPSEQFHTKTQKQPREIVNRR